MRTSVEITEAQHEALNALALRRGLRGFSQLVQEAVDAYLQDLNDSETDVLLSLEGILDDEEATEVLARIDGARSVWRAS